MKVYTESGSCYEFRVFENSLRTLFRTKELIVESIENLKVGQRMTLRGHDMNFYCQVSDDDYVLTTSKVVKIEP